jgi:hypothetical protein
MPDGILFNYAKNENIMSVQKETIFEIGGEGGGISIYRLRSKLGEKYIYHHSEFDPTEEGPGVNFKHQYATFEEPFQLIINRYSWYTLHMMKVHEDIRNYVIEELIKDLNSKCVTPEDLRFSKYNLERSLKIRLIYRKKGDNKIWSYKRDPKGLSNHLHGS